MDIDTKARNTKLSKKIYFSKSIQMTSHGKGRKEYLHVYKYFLDNQNILGKININKQGFIQWGMGGFMNPPPPST
jgi:hypothetical protein